jgi:hypothetical protein
MDGIKYQPPAPRYIPSPLTTPLKVMIDAKKRGWDAVGTKINTSTLKPQKPLQQRSF